MGVKNCQCFGRLCEDSYICIELGEVGTRSPPKEGEGGACDREGGS